MKTALLCFIAAFFVWNSSAQNPVIAGDLMLCPGTNGTAAVTSSTTYDSYQWQFRWNFGNSSFENIAGATTDTFSYSAYDYSVTRLRVLATLDGTTYTSNELEIDGYAFLNIYTITDFEEGNASYNPNDGSLMLCQGGSATFTVGIPYNTNIQWYRNGVIMAGETNTVLTVTAPGEYYVNAAPQVCPTYAQNSLPNIVSIDPNCSLAVSNPNQLSFNSWPNPVNGKLSFSSAETIESVSIFDIAGQKLRTSILASMTGEVDLSSLSSGIYILEAKSAKATKKLKIVKQ